LNRLYIYTLSSEGIQNNAALQLRYSISVRAVWCRRTPSAYAYSHPVAKRVEYKVALLAQIALSHNQGRHLGGGHGEHLPPWFLKIVIICVFAPTIFFFFKFCFPPPIGSRSKLCPPLEKTEMTSPHMIVTAFKHFLPLAKIIESH